MVERKMTLSEEEREREALVVLSALAAGLVAAILWVVHTRLFITNAQLIEMSLWPLPACFWVLSVVRYLATRNARRKEVWPRATPVIRPDRDRKYLAEAAANDAVLLGYRTNGSPFYWSNRLRSMQAICFGQTGAGKSTLLESITQQDIARGHVRQGVQSLLIESPAAAFYPPLDTLEEESEGLHLEFSGMPEQLADARKKRRNSPRGGFR
jgi:hypothetical protein